MSIQANHLIGLGRRHLSLPQALIRSEPGGGRQPGVGACPDQRARAESRAACLFLGTRGCWAGRQAGRWLRVRPGPAPVISAGASAGARAGAGPALCAPYTLLSSELTPSPGALSCLCESPRRDQLSARAVWGTQDPMAYAEGAAASEPPARGPVLGPAHSVPALR